MTSDPAPPSPQAISRRILVWASAGAVVVALLALLGGRFLTRGEPSAGHGATPDPSPTLDYPATPTGAWSEVAGLRGANQLAVAPSDPDIVYAISGQGEFYDNSRARLRRTDDNGATWHDLSIPGGPLTGETFLGVVVSPVDATTVFLAVGRDVHGCPQQDRLGNRAGAMALARSGSGAILGAAPRSSAIGQSGVAFCNYQYVSHDSGQHWREVSLPVPSTFSFDTGVRPLAFDPVLWAQGTHLYVREIVANNHQGTIPYVMQLRSDDGGDHWKSLDAINPIGGDDSYPCIPATSGSTVFAVTSTYGNTLHLWRSDDAGDSWSLVGGLPRNSYEGVAVVGQPGNAQPLLYLGAYDTSLRTALRGPQVADLMLSADGGHTWKPVAAAGIPTGMSISPSPIGVLRDGSVVISAPPYGPDPPATLTYYAWKSGDPAWRQLTPAVLDGFTLALTSPLGGPEALWTLSYQADHTATVHRFVLP